MTTWTGGEDIGRAVDFLLSHFDWLTFTKSAAADGTPVIIVAAGPLAPSMPGELGRLAGEGFAGYREAIDGPIDEHSVRNALASLAGSVSVRLSATPSGT